MIVRWVLLILLIWVLARMVRSLLAQTLSPPEQRHEAQTDLARCAQCGVHVVEARMIAGKGGKKYCSETCRARSLQAVSS